MPGVGDFPAPSTGWQNTPPATWSQIRQWYFWAQFWYAVRERIRAKGGKYFPAVSKVWFEGTITAAVDNGDGTSTLTFAETFCTTAGDVPWVFPCDPTPPSDAPGTYEGAIDDDDAVKAVGNLTVNSVTAHTVTIAASLNDYVASKQWGAVGDAVGRTFAVTRPGEPWWNAPRRFPAWPNSATFVAGTVLGSTATTIRVDRTTWATGQWNGYEVMYKDAAGRLHRGAITATTTDLTNPANPVGVLTFTADYAGTPATGSLAKFAIIKAGGLFAFDRPYFYPTLFYSGEFAGGVATHAPLDILTGGSGAPVTFTDPYDHSEDDGSPCSCPPDTCDRDPMLDTDAKTPDQAVCVAPSHFLNPDVTRTPRYLQALLETMCREFLPQNTPQGSGFYSRLVAWNGYGTATWFAAMGLDSWSGTVASGAATVDTSGFEYGDGLDVVWAIKDPHGGVVAEGSATLTAAGGYAITGLDTAYNGFPIVVSAGWHRFFERMIGQLRDHAWFLPDFDPSAGGGVGAYVVPPTSAFPGNWRINAAPNAYLETQAASGVRGNSAKPKYAMADGHHARMVGQAYADPSNAYGLDTGGDPTIPAVHYDRSFIGRRRPAVQDRIIASMSGRTTTFTARQITDPARNWWRVDFWEDGGLADGGALLVHSGTDAVSATGVTLTSLAGTGFVTQTPPRFMQNGGWTIRFRNGFDADGLPIWIYRQLASQNSSAAVTFTENMTVTGSMYWELVEPSGQPNRWKTCTVKLIFNLPDGTGSAVQTVTLDGNGDRSLYLPAGVTVPAGAVSVDYSIDDLEMDTGAVLVRAAGKWSRCTGGADAVRRGVPTPADFLPDPHRNQPDLMKDYGRMVPGDLVLPMVDQIKKGIQAFKYWTLTNGWTAKSSPTAAQINNSISYGTGSCFWGVNANTRNWRAVTNCSDGSDLDACGSNDMLVVADLSISGSVDEGAAPGATTTVILNESSEIFGFADAAFGHITQGLPIPGVTVNDPSVQLWVMGTFDATVNCSYAGACGPDGADQPQGFAVGRGVTNIACNDWTNPAGYSISVVGTRKEAYSGLVGSTTHVEAFDPIMCDIAGTCGPPGEGGSDGGYSLAANVSVATGNFVYA